jgi:hypothetical protein
MESIENTMTEELKRNIAKFHQEICDYVPHFARKMKTHLLLHVVC